MDVFLLTASAGLGTYLPKEETLQASKSVKFALGLSLGLLSLSILEATPSHWMVLLEQTDNNQTIFRNGSLTLTGAYGLILWIVCIWIVVVLPGSVGGHVFQDLMIQRRRQDGDEKKSQLVLSWQHFPWWVRFAGRFFTSILCLVYRLVMAPLLRLLRRQFRSSTEPILVLTRSQGGSRHGAKGTPNLPNNHFISRTFLLGSFFGILATMLMLRTLGPLVVQVQSGHHQVLSTLVSWLCAIGLLISSVMNGFGCVSMPHSCLAGWSLESVRPEVIAGVELELQETIQSYESKVAELSNANNLNLLPRRKASFLPTRKTFSDYSEESHQRKLMLQKELDFQDMLIGELRVDLMEMKHAHEAAVQARTPMGKVRMYVGITFSVVLLVRLYTAVMNILRGDAASLSARADPITTALMWLTGHELVSQQDYNKFSQGISLLLTACLSISQVSTFLRTISSVNRRLSLVYRRCYCTTSSSVPRGEVEKHSPSDDRMYTRSLAALMGCYFVSCVVLTKMSLPIEYRSSFAAALGGMDFSIQSSVVNLVFCLSAGVSAAILGVLLGIQRQNTKRYAQEASTLPPC